MADTADYRYVTTGQCSSTFSEEHCSAIAESSGEEFYTETDAYYPGINSISPTNAFIFEKVAIGISFVILYN